MEIIQLTKFSGQGYHNTKWGSDLQKFKHDVLENLGLQISGISRQQIPSMLVSIGVQHSQFAPGFVTNITITPFVDASLLLARSLTEFLPKATGTFDFVGTRVYGYKPNCSKLVILSISDFVPDKSRDLLEDILPNQMVRKFNLILLLIVWS